MKTTHIFFQGLLVISLVFLCLSFGLIDYEIFKIQSITKPSLQMLGAAEFVFFLSAAGLFLTNKIIKDVSCG